ncbi:MAG: DRTGG domain-containing protein [Christensenellales bacterium]|jgi:predicted transcriptional regulator
MTIQEVKEILDATVYCCANKMDHEIHTACGSDLMSDVLAFAKDQPVLLSGMMNPQVVRTAEMMDIECIVFVRNKQPDEITIEMAKEKEICLLATKHHMFTACGLLYENGLRGGVE